MRPPPAAPGRVKIPVSRTPGSGSDIPLPAYATPGAAGMDLRAVVDSPLGLAPGERLTVPCGIRIAIPKGYEGQVRPRSGLASRHGIGLLNSPGTIDSDYRGEIRVVLVNHGRETFVISRGDRIAQLVIAPVADVSWEESAGLDDTPRGEGGFGHTGR